jgi:hypothetical protein
MRPRVHTVIRSTIDDRAIPLDPDPVVEAYKKDVDRTLLRENLKLSVEERLLKLIELQRFAEELRRAGREARAGS